MTLQNRFFGALTVFSGAMPSTAQAANHLITDFTYQSCAIAERVDRCIEVKAPKAWLSQLRSSTHMGFSTNGLSEVRLLDSKGEVKERMSAIEATLHAELGLLALDFADGSSMLISLDSGTIEKIGSSMNKAEVHGQGGKR